MATSIVLSFPHVVLVPILSCRVESISVINVLDPLFQGNDVSLWQGFSYSKPQ